MRPLAGKTVRRTWYQPLPSTYALVAVIAALGVTSAESAQTYWRDLRAMQTRPSEAQDALQTVLQSRFSDSFMTMFPETVRAQLMSFYASRQFRPAWSGGAIEQERAGEAIAVLMRAGDQGLRSEDYLSSIEFRERPRRGIDAAHFDIALTAAVLRYAHDVAVGRLRPNDIYKDVKLPAPNFDAVEALTRMLRGRSITASLADLPPPHPQYRRLAAMMARYRAVEAGGGWPSLPARGEIGFDGDDRRTKALIQRLASEDDALAANREPSSEDIREAVKRYQSRNGLDADGRVAGATLTALNVPVSSRIEVLAANMERWRWLPRTLENRYIAVNVPDQSVEFVRNGDVVLSSRVVVGRKTSRTPILKAEAVAIIANPPWEIPGDIVVNQLLPKLRRSSGYLQASNMVLMNGPSNDPFGRKVNWRNVSPDAFPFKVVQIPGPHNALGNLMIDTPNDFDVYLHDTPGKALFKSADRAVSNGCIRVEAIFQLASLILDESDADTRLKDLIAARDTKRVPLARPVPVYFLYWTAIAVPDGGVGFRGDLYGRDARLIEALAKRTEDQPELAVTESNVTEPVAGSARISDTLLPATGEPLTDTDHEFTPLDERGSELPPLDERGSELAPVNDPGTDVTPSQTESAMQNRNVADAVRRADENTRFTDTRRRSDAARTTEPTGLKRTWPDDGGRYGRSKRLTQSEPAFPLLKRLFEGNRPRDPYARRGSP